MCKIKFSLVIKWQHDLFKIEMCNTSLKVNPFCDQKLFFLLTKKRQITCMFVYFLFWNIKLMVLADRPHLAVFSVLSSQATWSEETDREFPLLFISSLFYSCSKCWSYSDEMILLIKKRYINSFCVKISMMRLRDFTTGLIIINSSINMCSVKLYPLT